MQLLELEVVGFKSFATRARLKFGPGITAVIGPNGSGKSNLAEAVRWVLGEQSLKSLRGRKTEDVIFSGNDKRRGSGQARVSLLLSNEVKRMTVEAEEVDLTRLVTRSGDSEYLLNGDPMRLVDIQQMLAEAGLGTKSYSVISQGTVDQYLTASPTARRELFDEACGIKSLQIKMRRAEQKLAQADLRIHDLQTVLQELEPKLKVLRRQAKRLEQREDTAKRYERAQAGWYRQAWHEMAAAVQRVQSQAEEDEQKLAVARQERKKAEAALFAALTAGEENKEASLWQRRQTLEQELLQAEQEYERNTRLYEQNKEQKRELTASLEQVRQALRSAQQKLARAREEVRQDDIMSFIGQLLRRCHSALASWLAGNQPDSDDIRQLNNQLAQAMEQLNSEGTSVAAAQTLMRKLEEPLQAVARLQAVEHERQAQLKKIPQLMPPDHGRLVQLRRVYESADTGQDGWEAKKLEKLLAQSRDEELLAERNNSAGAAAMSQARGELAALESEIRRERGTQFLVETQHSIPDKEDLATSQELVRRLSARLAALGEPDPLIAREYQETAARFAGLEKQRDDILAARHNTDKLIKSLKRETEHKFRQQFAAIQKAFQDNFTRLFGGGAAQLEIVDCTVDELEEGQTEEAESRPVQGIEIMAHPPGKRPRHINLLSGGEKALTSLALLLAILQVQKPPFLVLDEVDAALDEANSVRFGGMLKLMSEHTQCVVITHNRAIMAEADVLYGVTMGGDGVSKVYSVKMADIEEAEEFSETMEV
ncbi:MAG: AAA family ATPase [Candidatus Andersenbacteria bacterium]|nr:AAA family ATPase [bacterium]MDZ4225855.1 AAA family ATPase [Candidatus Andersenbacteria bacterium]